MRAVLQRVRRSTVTVGTETVGSIDRGWLVLLGIAATDTSADIDYLADKVLGLRAFPDAEGKMNLSVGDVQGALLVVSQFTLYGDCRKGRRPGFTDAAPPALAVPMYEQFVAKLRASGLTVATGRFQADMQVELVNDGPVTLMLDSGKAF